MVLLRRGETRGGVYVYTWMTTHNPFCGSGTKSPTGSSILARLIRKIMLHHN
ncbi:hypothetical protein Hdeb2414_s0003g00108731 [Helianthus debilis subsp. tardiflorus]